MKRMLLLVVFVVTYQTWEARPATNGMFYMDGSKPAPEVYSAEKKEFFDDQGAKVQWNIAGSPHEATAREQADFRVRELKGDPHRNWDVRMYELKEVTPR